MSFCLIPKYADKFREALQSGEIDPEKMMSMSSEERQAYLEPLVGEFNAKGANTLFEEKLLLQNQQAGLINWAKKLSGISEKYRTDILDKIQKLDKALTPQSQHGFLSDIVEQRLGVSVTKEEGGIISDLASKARELYIPGKPNYEQPIEFWQAKQRLLGYMRDIKPELNATSGAGKFMKGVDTVLSVQRAVKTGFDLSASLRQGAALFGTKEWNQAFVNMFKYARSQSALDELEVRMLASRYSDEAIANKNALGLTMLGEKFTQREEAFGSKFISHIPGLAGSERAYVGFLNDLRFSRFTNILENLDKSGNGITDNKDAMKDLAKVIGAATGRGSLGRFEGGAPAFAAVLFSPRWIASRFELILNPITKGGLKINSPARVEAIKALGRTAGVSVAVLTMAKAAGLGVETNPISSDFGKVKVGKTRYDMTGGMGGYITLIAREAQGKTKSSTTGRISRLNTGKFGSQTRLDVALSFMEGKTAPVAGVVKDIAQGSTYGGQKVKVGLTKDFGEYLASQLVQPMLSSDAIDAYTSAAGGAKLNFKGAAAGGTATAASIFGVGVNTYK